MKRLAAHRSGETLWVSLGYRAYASRGGVLNGPIYLGNAPGPLAAIFYFLAISPPLIVSIFSLAHWILPRLRPRGPRPTFSACLMPNLRAVSYSILSSAFTAKQDGLPGIPVTLLVARLIRFLI